MLGMDMVFGYGKLSGKVRTPLVVDFLSLWVMGGG